MLITTRQFLLLAVFFCSLRRAVAAAEATSVEVFVGREKTSRSEAVLAVPAGTDTLRFLVKPKSLFARYKLDGLDEDWSQQVDTIFLRVAFFNQKGDPIKMYPFPASGRSAGWKGTIQDSSFTDRVEKLTVPDDAASLSLIMTTAGPASLVGIFAIREASGGSTRSHGAQRPHLCEAHLIQAPCSQQGGGNHQVPFLRDRGGGLTPPDRSNPNQTVFAASIAVANPGHGG